MLKKDCSGNFPYRFLPVRRNKCVNVDAQGCYIGRMHGGLQLALTRLFEAPEPARFHQLTSLTLRDFLEPHGTPSKRVTSRVRLCKVENNLEYYVVYT